LGRGVVHAGKNVAKPCGRLFTPSRFSNNSAVETCSFSRLG
jgi:hypothetical protein